MTNMVGNFHNPMPVLKASASFPADAIALVDADQYTSANPTYATTNVFYRQVRNLVFDMTSVPSGNLVRGIHWPTAQATSLQNCVFKMSAASGNKHVGVFIENGKYWWRLSRGKRSADHVTGSGGFLNDLVFYGGNQAMNVGSQQFTSRNLTFYK
jgi:glucan 1,3-beta-glucosidase